MRHAGDTVAENDSWRSVDRVVHRNTDLRSAIIVELAPPAPQYDGSFGPESRARIRLGALAWGKRPNARPHAHRARELATGRFHELV